MNFILGLTVGIAACEVVGRHLAGYSVVMDAWEWMRGYW